MKNRNIKNWQQHDFYCLYCGNRNISILRPRGYLRERGHRKVLYCPYCKNTVNHYECRDDEEAFDFKEKFKEGIFIEEAEESILFVKEDGNNGNQNVSRNSCVE